MRQTILRSRSISGLALALALGLPAVQAATFTVTTTADSGAGSLRDAISQANAAAGADTINFDSATFADSPNAVIAVTSGQLSITDDVTIDGTGFPARIFIRGNNSSRIFNIGNSSSATLNRLFVSEGTDENGGCINIDAGASLLGRTLGVGVCTATGSGPGNGGGAIFNAGTVDAINLSAFTSTAINGAGNGGGILNAPTGSLTLTGRFTFIDNNKANRAGGGIENNAGTVVLNTVNIRLNEAVGGLAGAPGRGGGIHTSGGGTVTINGGLYEDNKAGQEGGALWNSPAGIITVQRDSNGAGARFLNNDVNLVAPVAGDTTRGGGAIFTLGKTSVVGATFDGNDAIGPGANGGALMSIGASGDLTVTDSEIKNSNAARAGGASETQGGATTVLTNVTATNNTAGVNGGAVHGAGGVITVNGGTYNTNVAANEGGAMWMRGGTITVTGTTMDNNTANGADKTAGGGGFFIDQGATGTLRNVVITNNKAPMGLGSGGGILNDAATLVIENSRIEGNTARRAGGGLEDLNGVQTTITDSQFRMNRAEPMPGNGGGIHISGTGNMTVSRSLFQNNTASREGGGLWNSGGNSSLVISNSMIDANTADGDAAHDGGGGLFNNGGVLTVNDSQITGNEALGTDGSGGGILNLSGTLNVNRTEISGNSSTRAGGGIEDNSNGDGADVAAEQTKVTISETTIRNNSTGNKPGNGGGIHITGNGVMSIDKSTINGNTAAKEGGGVWNFNTSTMTVSNSTIFGNSSPDGGGVFTQTRNAGGVTLIHTTVANNTGNTKGGGISMQSGGSVTINNSLVANNSSPNGPDISGTVTSNSSLVRNPAGATVNGSSVNGNPALAALANNGGPTLTAAIGQGPAIDAGNASICSGGDINNEDQRSMPRPLDGDSNGASGCDLGAFELTGENPVGVTAVQPPNPGRIEGFADGVGLLGVSVINNAGEGIQVNGFAGRIIVDGATPRISNGRVVIDSNRNGQADAGEPVVGSANVNLNPVGRNFTVSFTNGRSVGNGVRENYLLVADIGGSAAAAIFAAPLLLLLWVRRRSLQLLVIASSFTMLITGCGGGSGDSNGPASGIGFVQLQADQVMAQAGSGPATRSVSSTGLPVSGPRILQSQ